MPSPPLSPRKPQRWAWRYRRLLFLTTLLTFTALSGTAFVLVRVPLPPEAPQAQTTLITDANGVRLASLDSGENRVLVDLSEVPKVVVDAVLAAEDKAFFDHGGLDPFGIARATWADVRGRSLQGGSTITQQYVKNVYLGRERTVWRKFKEAILAMKIERKLGKYEILERYLNTIYLGRGAYGVQAAARAYFGKDVSELGLREAAYLAGLIRSPEAADATRSAKVATARRDRTLVAMQRAGSITAAQRAAAAAQPVSSYVVSKANSESTFAMPDKGTQYFVEYIRRQLLTRYDETALYRGGLRVKTTLDLRTQAQAYDAVYGFLDRPDDPAGALVAIDDRGHVKAMVGGRDWDAQVPYAKVNLAVGREGGGTGRQPGSTFKPFVLAAAVRDGYTVKSSFPGPAEAIFPRADEGKDYPVKNFEDADFGSSVDLIEATRNSVNTVYAQLIKSVGPDSVIRLARASGISSPLVQNISLALGTSEVSVLEMASAYSTFANRGVHLEPNVILEVTTADGRVLEPARPPARTKVLEPAQADVVNFCLQQVVRGGSGTRAAFGRPVAGKTGTTQDFGDAWFVGYTPKLTTAVWMGFPEGIEKKMDNVRGQEVRGGSFPAAIFKRFMQAVAKTSPDSGSFPTVTSFPGTVLRVPDRVILSTTTTTSPSAASPTSRSAPPSRAERSTTMTTAVSTTTPTTGVPPSPAPAAVATPGDAQSPPQGG
ncbi:MAG: hypothetical protein CYG61_01220 [Actinobacteria bacterium]|nr:MAG: hypothetical protein CYG61_01220 [Actinomycetota bacterium]